MIISASKNFIFIHLEKCGGTSVENALQPYLHWSDMIIGSTEFGEKLQSLYYERFGRNEVNENMLWKHSSAKDIHAFIGKEYWDDFTKISIVRNPEDIVKSLYSFSMMTIKYHIGRLNRGTWKELISTNSYPEYYPFTEGYIHAYAESVVNDSGLDGFVDILFKKNHNFIKTQTERIQVNNNIDMGFIIDLSDIDRGWKTIKNALQLPSNVALEKLNASEPLNITLSNRSKKIIRNHFAIDYDLLPRYTGITW